MKKEYEDIFIQNLNFPIRTLKEICFDKRHPEEYLTDSTIGAIDFDELVKQYCKEGNMEKRPRTNDALYLSGEEWFFIEFKNGQIVDEFSDTHTAVTEIQEKIVSSLAVLFSVTRENQDFEKYFPFYKGELSYTSKHINYILVYNPKKNEDVIKSDKKGWKRQVNSGFFDEEIHYFSKHYEVFFSRPSDVAKYQKRIRTVNIDETKKQEMTPEFLAAREYFIERINNGFKYFIKDIRAKLLGKNIDTEFDIFGESVLEETEPSYREGQLPLLVRFGLDKYAGSYVKDVFTYAGAYKQKDGTYNYRESEFYLNFVRHYENE